MPELTIPIRGMHCKACTIVIADELSKLPGVKQAQVNLKTNSATIKYTSKPTQNELEFAVKTAGYAIGDDKKSFFSHNPKLYGQFLVNLFAILIIYSFLRGMGVTNIRLGGVGGNNGLMALVIGLTAGFSTCMALVGGLVLGLSSRFAEKHPTATAFQKFRPHLFFNASRIIAFFILGGLVGSLGAIFRLNSTTLGFLTVVVGLVMIIIGFQLTELFPRLSKVGLALPPGLSKFLGIKKHGSREYSHKNAMALGALTFFLPCGFTQAMQLVAMGSGSFVTGALVMGLFAIGTTPGLLSVGGLTSVVKGSFAKSFFRFAGVIVVALALYNVSNGLKLAGIKLPAINKNDGAIVTSSPAETPASSSSENATVIKATYTLSGGINPNKFNARAGQPYVLEVEAKDDGQGCMSTILIPGLYTTAQLIKKGETIKMPFTANNPGNYKITCAMGISFGTINVIK